jgi:hypothetical protein
MALEPVADDDIGFAGKDITAFNVADEIERGTFQ